jgi:hypothetical protein
MTSSKCAIACGVAMLLSCEIVSAQPAPLPPLNPQKTPVFAGPGRYSVVANAPYSADVISTVTQVLADGTRIEQSVTGKVYRDAAGRMRREQQVLGLAALLSSSTETVTAITITDPTAGVTYTIDDRARTARRAPYLPVLQMFSTPLTLGSVDWLAPEPGAAAVRLQAGQAIYDLAGLSASSDVRLRAFPLVLDAPGGRQGGGRGRSGAPATAAAPESLGARQLEGVTVTGQRFTQTIPTGQIGNDRPIVITDEIWESPDLQVLVSSKHHDPRSGDVEYRLRNISRNEPAATLFQVPAGYTVVDPQAPYANAVGGRSGGGRGGAPVPPPAPRAPGQ